MTKNNSLLLAVMVAVLAIVGSIGLQRSAVENNAQTTIAEIAELYVKLTLQYGEHESGYIDAYYGPVEWQEQAKAESAELDTLLEAVTALRNQLSLISLDKDSDDLQRSQFLEAQLNALSFRIQTTLGLTNNDFDSQSVKLFDTATPQYAWSHFDKVLDSLNSMVPGEGALHDRISAFQSQLVIPNDRLAQVFERAIAECRARTLKNISLPDNESFVVEYVTDQPWSGYNWYKGDNHSVIQVNIDLPIAISRAVDLGCHEGYPGHHTYNTLLESELYRGKGWVEFSVYPLFSPQSLIAEGSANYGIELAFSHQERIEFEKNVLFPLAGLAPELAQQNGDIQQLTEELNFAGNEVARQYLAGAIDAERAAELLVHYALMSPEKAKQRVKFIDKYGAYVINYNWGKRLVAQYVEVDGASKEQTWLRFNRLLSSPVRPAQLEARNAQ